MRSMRRCPRLRCPTWCRRCAWPSRRSWSPSTSVRGSRRFAPPTPRASGAPAGSSSMWWRRPRSPLRPRRRLPPHPSPSARALAARVVAGRRSAGPSSSTPGMAATSMARAARRARSKRMSRSASPGGSRRRSKARLGARVILTRDADATVGLDERAAVANNNKADVFLSLHANASVRAVGRWRGGLLPEPRRLRRTGATRGPGRGRGAAGVRRRHARHRSHPVGDGPGPSHRAVGQLRAA